MKTKRTVGPGSFSLVINFVFITFMLIYYKGNSLVTLMPLPLQNTLTILLLSSLPFSVYLTKKYPKDFGALAGRRLSTGLILLFILGLCIQFLGSIS